MSMEEMGPGQGDAFVTAMLRAALSAPGADVPRAGRIVAGLLGVLVAEGAGGEVAAVMAAEPGAPTTFEVHSTTTAAATATERLGGLDAEAALRASVRLARTGADLVEAVGLGPDGLRRIVLRSRHGAAPSFLVPDESTMGSNPVAAAAAIARWRRGTAGGAAPPAAWGGGAEHPVRRSPGFPAFPEEGAATQARVNPDPGLDLRRRWPGISLTDDVTVLPGLDDIVRRAVADALEEVTVEVDMAAVETVVARAMAARQGPPVAASTQLAAPGPPPGDNPTAGPAIAALGAARELLAQQVEAFEDRVRASSHALGGLADDMAAGARYADDALERLSQRLAVTMERMGRHLEQHIDTLALNRPTAAQLARFTANLEAALDALRASRPGGTPPSDRDAAGA